VSSLSQSGGGATPDGTPVSKQLGADESFTVPAGETYVGRVVGVADPGNRKAVASIDGNNVVHTRSSSQPLHQSVYVVLVAGQTVKAKQAYDDAAVHFTGWSV
jgi:hypothetical protein